MVTEEHMKATRSLRKHEVNKLVCQGLYLFFLMEMMLCVILEPSIFNVRQSVALGRKVMLSLRRGGEVSHKYSKIEMASVYNLSNARSDVYEISGDIRVANNLSTIFIPSSLQVQNGSTSWTIRPYIRQYVRIKHHTVREWKIQTRSPGQFPSCSRHFDAPAVLFSTGAFPFNYFHAFNDIFIPLYLTTQHFDGKVVLLISNYLIWRENKHDYVNILNSFTRYDIVHLDGEKEVLCFPKLIAGLTSNKEFSIDPLQPPHYSMTGFTQFMRNTYSLKRDAVTDVRKPRMLLISRRFNRILMNEGEVAKMARDLGFDVVVKDTGSNLTQVAQFVNSVDVMVGVHGAGLTNMVFLPEKAVVIQITPFAIEGVSETYFGLPARDMKLRYIEYKATVNESSLARKYPADSEVCRDPHGIEKRKGLVYFHNLYLRDQNVIVDLVRFKAALLKALKLFGN